MSDQHIPFDPCVGLIEELGALEQAIVDICDIDTVHEIHERVRMIQKI